VKKGRSIPYCVTRLSKPDIDGKIKDYYRAELLNRKSVLTLGIAGVKTARVTHKRTLISRIFKSQCSKECWQSREIIGITLETWMIFKKNNIKEEDWKTKPILL